MENDAFRSDLKANRTPLSSSVTPNFSNAAPVQMPLTESFSKRTLWMGPKGEKIE